VGFIGGAVSKALPAVLAGIDASLGTRFPFVGRLLRQLRLSPGPEFESQMQVLSLYDRDQVAKLAKDDKSEWEVPAQGAVCSQWFSKSVRQ
jgi:hypothetical protein